MKGTIRTEAEIYARRGQLTIDALSALTASIKIDWQDEYASRLAVLLGRYTPQQADRLSVNDPWGVRCAAIREAQWLYGYEESPWTQP